jgi:thymidylate kinase
VSNKLRVIVLTEYNSQEEGQAIKRILLHSPMAESVLKSADVAFKIYEVEMPGTEPIGSYEIEPSPGSTKI